ncbi:Slp family lipoprotein, partial [Nissabacter archeti]
MRKPSMKGPIVVAILSLAALSLTGCVTVPDVIKGTTATPQQNLAAVQNAPQLYVGQEARFGGSVVNMTNEKNRTRLEIAAVPLDSAARPVLGERSTGRLVAYINGFVDPVDLRGQLVTVVGPITGAEQGKIGQTDYTFVVMNANSYKRWRLQQQVVMPPGPTGPWGWGG